MRFEIGWSEGIVILLGLLGLSTAVFFMGMVSEHEMTRSQQGPSEITSIYPMPAAAPSASLPQVAQPIQPSAAPIAAAAPKAHSQTAVTSQDIAPSALPEPSHEYKASPHPALASVPPRKSDKSDTDKGTTALASGTGTHQGYKIEIDAVDRSAADRMVSRLIGLGYSSEIVPREINGRTWYQVQVGPYRSSAAARAAQARLQAAYTARYVDSTTPYNAGAGPAELARWDGRGRRGHSYERGRQRYELGGRQRRRFRVGGPFGSGTGGSGTSSFRADSFGTFRAGTSSFGTGGSGTGGFVGTLGLTSGAERTGSKRALQIDQAKRQALRLGMGAASFYFPNTLVISSVSR